MITHPYNLLIADDIIMNRFLLKEVVASVAGNIYEAANGKEVIQILYDHPVDIILMDIEMPVMNGLETTRYIRNKLESPLNRIPIIALTAHNPLDFFKTYQEAGFDQLITKPYSINKVTQTIQSIQINPNTRSDD